MPEQRPFETRSDPVVEPHGSRHHIEKGWTVYDAVQRPIGNVTEIDTTRDVLTVDGRPQGFGAYEVPLNFVERAADNDVHLSKAVDSAPNVIGSTPTFLDAPASTGETRSRSRPRAEPSTPAASGPVTSTTPRSRLGSTTTSPANADTMREFTPPYATTELRDPAPIWPDEDRNRWSTSKIAIGALALGGLAAATYVMRRRMARKSAFERFVDVASRYAGGAGDYATVAADFARQRHPAWWASLAAAALPLAYYAWPSPAPTYSARARSRADDFASYVAGLTATLPTMSASDIPSRLEDSLPSMRRAMHRGGVTDWPPRADIAGAVGAIAAGALGIYLMRRMTSGSGTGQRIGDVMTRQPRVIQPDATVADAAAMMRRLDVGALPVCDGTRLIGMLTDRDITTRSTADGRDPYLTPVRDVMSPGVAWATEDDFVEEAARIMREHRIRRLPIVDERHSLVGVVSLGDLAVDVRDDELSGDTLERISEKGRTARDW